MFLSCFYQNCKELDLWKCECQNPIFTCLSHLKIHNQEFPSLPHSSKKESSICRKDSNPEFTRKLINLINEYRNLKKSFIESLNSLNALAFNFMSNIDKVIESLHKQIFNSSSYNQIFFQENLKDFIKNYPSQASEKEIFYIDQKCWEFLQVPQFNIDLKSTFESFTSKLNMKFKDVHMDQSKNDLVFFESNSIILNIFKIEEKVMHKKIINLENMQNNLGGLCYVNEHTIYFLEDCNESSNPKSFLIDLNKFEAREIKGSTQNSYSSCTVYKKKVYTFGGYSKAKEINEAKYLDLDDEQYYRITNLPSSQYSTSVVNIGTNFIISGNNNKHMYIYDIVNDTYKYHLLNKGFGNYHLLIALGNKVYAVLNTWIIEFEYSDKDGGRLTEVKSVKYGNSGFDYVTGKPVVRGNMAYFNDYKGNVFRVDLDALNVIQVREIHYKEI